MKNRTQAIGCAFLVAGISIGVGMLGLPVATANAGFFPSLAAYLAVWLFMLCTGLLTLEACHYVPNGNLLSMSRLLLGKKACALTWIVYLFLLTCLMIAHYAGAGMILQEVSASSINYYQGAIFFTLLLWPIIGGGEKILDRCNRFFMTALIATYILFCLFCFPHIQTANLLYARWPQAFAAVPVIFTAFGYQILIPSLMNITSNNTVAVRRGIVWGTFLPFFIYVVWQLLISGILTKQALMQAHQQGQNAIVPLSLVLNNPFLVFIGNAFAIITLITSYLGLSLGFLDFLADGLKVSNKGLSRFFLCCLIFLAPLGISLIDPSIFLKALGYAGGIGCSLLLGVLPVAMAWSGRKKHQEIAPQLPGGRPALCVLAVLCAAVLFMQLLIG